MQNSATKERSNDLQQVFSYINDGGRPLFARDADKHRNPAPNSYKPDKFAARYGRSHHKRSTVANEARFKD